MSIRVFIGVGHGGSDSGASSYVKEKDANLTIALELQKQLEAAGLVVGMSRTKDENDPIGEEVNEANAFKPDLAVEVHNNAGGGDGFEVFVQTNKYAAKSRAAAQAIEAEVKALGQKSRGIKTSGFWWTNGVKAPAVLLEGFFVDKWEDAKDFDTVAEQKKLGQAYARGVLKYLGIDPAAAPEKEPEPAPAPAPVTTYTLTASGAVQYKDKAAADAALAKLKALGFAGTIAAKAAQTREIKKGDTVRVKKGARYYDDKYKDKTPNPVIYDRVHKVHSIAGNRVVISYSGVIIGAMHKDNLTLVD